MKWLLGIAVLLGVASHAWSQTPAPVLSPNAEVSLFTCSPGEELYSLFGHSAMRVHDPAQGIDVVFNYGTFTFDDDFYYNFIMGKLNYQLGLASSEAFLRAYAGEGRGIIEQQLSLDSAERQAVFDFLHWNQQPENRYYLYDFFYDNCSSILRDVLDTTLQGKVQFQDLSYPSNPSYRNMIDTYLVYHPWGDFGIDLGLGLPCDKRPNYLEYMFLPNELMRAYGHATIEGEPLVKQTQTLLKPVGLKTGWSITQPIPLFWMIFGLFALLTALGWRFGWKLLALDALMLIAYGAVGALLFFLWFITDHTATNQNFNMLWAWPTHLLFLPFLFLPKIRRPYFMAMGAVALIALLGFAWWPQQLHLATIPLMLIAVTRAAFHYFNSSKS